MKALALRVIAKKTLIGMAASVILLLLAYVVAHGTLKTFALGVVVAFAIPLGYVAIERPMLFPFGLYVLLVPIDDLLNVGHAGTITKLLGMMTFGALFFALLRRGELVKPTPGLLAWMAVAVWMGLSGFWTMDLKAWNPAYVTFAENFILYALLAITITSSSELETISTCIILGGLIASAIALWPFLHGGMTLQGRLVLPGSNRYDPPDPNQFAAALLLPFAILFAATLGTRKWGPRLVNLGGLAMLAITIVLTGSRGAMLALGVLLLYVLIRSPRRVNVAGILLVSVAAIVPFSGWLVQRWSTALSMGGSFRTDIWQVGIVAFKQHWLIGSGFASFPAAFDQSVLQAHFVHYIGWNRAPHDMLISTSVELGVVGLILMALVFVLSFRDLCVPSVDGFLGDMQIALQGALIAVFVDSLFLDITNRKYMWLIFIMIALVRSTLIGVARQRRKTVCATASSLTPVPTSEAQKLPA
jgi:hypothetical protein